MRNHSWFIRIFSIIFLLFISLFAFDSITDLLGFIIHLIPSFVVLLLIIISWKHQTIGGYLFIILGILSFIFFSFNAIIISLSIIFIGILYLLDNYFLKIKNNNEKRRKKINRNLL